MKSVNASNIAEVTGVTRQATVKRASKEKWKYIMEPTRGGMEKRYLVKCLPEKIRLSLAKNIAAEKLAPSTPAGLAGAEAGAKVAGSDFERVEKARIQSEAQLAEFSEIPAERQEIAYARIDVLKARDSFLEVTAASNIKKATIQFCELYNSGEIRIDEHVKKHVKKLSWSTLNRWKKSLTENGPASLAPDYKNPKKGTTKLTPEQVDFVLAMIYKHPHCSFEHLQMALESRFEDIPGMSCLRRFVSNWKKEHASLYLRITNPDKWRNKHQFAFGDASEHVVRLNQVWEFDSTPADIMLADGRYCLIGVIDVYSRRLKLHVSKTSKSSAVAALTRSALLDWGMPEIAKTDNGADYVSRHMVQVFEGLGIEQKLCPPFTPEAKPHIERAFKTFAHSFQEMMPGYIGHSVADRKDIENRKSFASRIMGENPIDIGMTAEELQSYCDRWCHAIYHQKKHRSLNNRTPMEVARAWRETVKMISNERALDILLAEAPGGGVRTVTKNGVSVDNITYISDWMPEVGTVVRVKVDATDLGTIYLFDERGSFLCVAQDPLRTGIDRAETAMKIKNRQQKYVKEGTKTLKLNARAQAIEDIHEQILEHKESQIDSIINFPGRVEEYSTPALEEAGKAADEFDYLSDESASFDEILPPPPSEEPLSSHVKKQEKVILLRTDADQYEVIRTKVKHQGGKLTRQEYDFLSEYYQTATGSSYMAIEGDFRETVGLKEGQAEA